VRSAPVRVLTARGTIHGTVKVGESLSTQNAGVRVLARPVRLGVVGRYTGDLTTALAALSLAPVLVAVFCGEWWTFLWHLTLSALLLGIGLGLRRLPLVRDLQPNEAMLAPALLFVIGPPLLAIPFVAEGIAPMDALFECVSALTTTGLSTLGSLDDRSTTFLFARAWWQWIGGLGVLVLVLALFVLPLEALRRFGTTNIGGADLVQSTRTHAKVLLRMYVAVTVIGALGLCLCGVGPFDALVHALAAVSTGGFSSHPTSLAAFAPIARGVVLAMCFAGALPLALYAPLRESSLRRILRGPEVKALLIAVLGCSALLVAVGWISRGPEIVSALGDLVAIGISAQTTAGFSTFSLAGLEPAQQLVLIASMGIGGEVGSTAGGVKLLRVLILWRLLQGTVRRLALPEHAYALPHLRGRILEGDEAIAALSLIALFIALAFLSWLPFLIAGYAPMDALFEVVSALGTVGLSSGVSDPDLPGTLKLVLCLDMWLGRLEILPLLLLLDPRTWTRFSRRTSAAREMQTRATQDN